MKSSILFTFILIVTTLTLSAQKIDIKTNIKYPTSINSSDGSIEVIIESGTPTFTFYLYNNKPWTGGKLLEKKENTFDKSCSFENLKPGSYFVLVEDEKKENPSGLTVELNVENTNN